ncbi:hypothetical protein B0H11DRAFT_2072516 [Mycena galericulata]|nr:hypothetical protein B0H11DRAFT_2072516 [Mycena galericulata]
MPCCDFPDELWAEVFANVPRDALFQTHLVCWRFCHITRRLLFREFTFYPKNYQAPSHRDVPADQDGLRDIIMQRLRFWTSSEIAPLIRTCHLRGRRPAPAVELLHPGSVLAELAHSFAHLTDVRYVSINVDCGRAAIDALWLLPNLTRLEIGAEASEININPPPPLLPLCISTFKLELYFWTGSSAGSWASLLPRDTLQCLDLMHNESLFAQLQNGEPFSNVTILRLNMQYTAARLSLQLLTKFPAVEVLSVSYPHSALQHDLAPIQSGPPLSNFWTALREYTGPDELLYMLLPIPSLRRLVLPSRDLDQRLRIFRSINHLKNNITSLCFDSHDFDSETLRHVCRLFPFVVDLQIRVTIVPPRDVVGFVSRWDTDHFFRKLIEESPLPTNTQKFAIRWEFVDDRKRVGFPGVDLHELGAALVARHPDMRAIWLSSRRFTGLSYFWRRGDHAGALYDPEQHDGRSQERAKSRRIRRELESHWNEI